MADETKPRTGYESLTSLLKTSNPLISPQPGTRPPSGGADPEAPTHDNPNITPLEHEDEEPIETGKADLFLRVPVYVKSAALKRIAELDHKSMTAYVQSLIEKDAAHLIRKPPSKKRRK